MNRYSTLVILIMFILIAILFANLKHKTEELLEQEDKIINLQIELDNAKEIIDKQNLQIRDYEIIFNNLTIEQRREIGKWVKQMKKKYLRHT